LVGGGAALLALGGCLLTEPLVPVQRENSPPVILSLIPDPSDDPIMAPSSGDPPSATFEISLDVTDQNNLEDVEVSWFLDFTDPEVPPCGIQGAAQDDSFLELLPGSGSDSRVSRFGRPIELGCHKVEAIVCDGRHVSAPGCADRGCEEGAVRLYEKWLFCVHDLEAPDCSLAACP